MRFRFVYFLLLITGSVWAQSPSSVLKLVMKATDEGRYEDLRKLLATKSDQEDIIHRLQLTKTKFGHATYFLQTDSTYKESGSQPKKYYEFKFNTYYEADLLKYEFRVVEEKDGYKLASFLYNPFKGNYNDPLLNSGTLTLPRLFVANIVAGKLDEAYRLFSGSLTETLSKEDFKNMAGIITGTLGELQSIEFIDTCTALNLYGSNESIGLFAIRLKGAKGDLYFNGTVAMRNDGTFFITRFQLFEQLEWNNPNEIKAAEALITEFYTAWTTGNYDNLYGLLHPEMQGVKSEKEIMELLEGLKIKAGKHNGHLAVSQIFSRNKNNSDLNKFMVVVENENQYKLLHDNFVLCYDKENKLKISYFYFVEY